MLREGRVDYLHYGLFHDKSTSLAAALQHSTELLLSRLPAAPCRILEVGVGLGTTYALLTGKGYQVHGITPDAPQIAYIHEHIGKDVAISCQRLEDFRAGPESYEVVLFQESGQYIDPLDIFNQSQDLLVSSGSLLLIDEFALRRVQPGMEGLHQIDDMIALAGRFGFELVERLDLSSLASPTLDYLLEATTAYRQQLIDDLNLQQETLDQLDASNRAYHEKYASGRYGYGLLHFRKKSVPRWRLRLLEEHHTDEMLMLFERVFGHRMEPEMYCWKYGAGRGSGIGIWREGRMVGHYGAMKRDILFFGQRWTAVQIGDVMVDSNERGVLTRSGPFFLMAATFVERHVGFGKPFLLGFGFPERRAMKLAELQGLYAKVGCMIELTWLPTTRMPKWLTFQQTVEPRDAWGIGAVNELWRQMAQDLQGAVVGVRDWQFLVHRYFAHPCYRYQVILVGNRFGGRFHAAFVLRREQGECELVDIVAPLKNIPLAISHARRLAGMGGDARLFCRITENFAPLFEVAGCVRQELDIHIPANAWSCGPAPDILQGQWWLMSGDTDYR